MAAPVLQLQGVVAAVTTGDLTVIIPAGEVADDILVVTTVAWVVNTTTGTNTIVAPAGWNKFTPAVTTITGGLIDAEWSFFWKRAVGGDADPVFARPTGWDTGNDTAWAGRCYVIRGCITTGDPWDAITNTAISAVANPALPAITVSGNERMAIVFAVQTDNVGLPTSATGYTVGTVLLDSTGTDTGFNSYRVSTTNTLISAVTPSGGVAPAQGGTVYFGVSFKQPVSVVSRTATGSGLGTQSATGVKKKLRTATGSGLGTQSATGARVAVITQRTATGSGVGSASTVSRRYRNFAKQAFGFGSSSAAGQSAVLNISNSAFIGAISGQFDGYSGNFIGNDKTLSLLSFVLSKTGTPTGTAFAYIYAADGSKKPTGSPLATSNAIDVSTLPTGQGTNLSFTRFAFTGSNKITLTNGVAYCAVFIFSGGDVSNFVRAWYGNGQNGYAPFDTSTFTLSLRAVSDGNWITYTTIDPIFFVETASATGVRKVSRTASGSGLGTQSATGVKKKLRTATGSGLGTQSATGARVAVITQRTASGSGVGTSTALKLRKVRKTGISAGQSSFIDYYSNNGFKDSVQRLNRIIGGTNNRLMGQSFTGNGSTVDSVSFQLNTNSNTVPINNVRAYIYEHLGVYGTNSSGGALLATSEPLTVRVFTSYDLLLHTFSFTGANKILLNNGTKYIVVLGGTTAEETIMMWFGNSNPVNSTTNKLQINHSGNLLSRGSTSFWATESQFDALFVVNPANATGVRKVSRTASGSGTGSQSATGVKKKLRTATGSGTGTQSATGVKKKLRTATGSGLGTQSATGVKKKLRTASGSGTGTQSATGIKKKLRTATGSGTGTQSATSGINKSRTANGSGLGTQSATKVVRKSRTASGSGTGTAIVVRVIIKQRTATASGTGISFATKDIPAEGTNWSFWGINALVNSS